jgi:UPF0148 protein
VIEDNPRVRGVDMDEEEALKKMTKLLEQGGTMLSTHHSCGAPLFRYRGDVVCPVCSGPEGVEDHREQARPGPREEISVGDEEVSGISSSPEGAAQAPGEGGGGRESSQVRLSSGEAISSSGAIISGFTSGSGREAEEGSKIKQDEQSWLEESLRSSILSRLRDLKDELRSEQDLGKLRSQLECVEVALRALRALER